MQASKSNIWLRFFRCDISYCHCGSGKAGGTWAGREEPKGGGGGVGKTRESGGGQRRGSASVRSSSPPPHLLFVATMLGQGPGLCDTDR